MSEPVVAVVVLLAAMAGVFALIRAALKPTDWSAWRQAASELGLDFTGDRIVGNRDGCHVVVVYLSADEGSMTQVSVKPSMHSIPPFLSVEKESDSSLRRSLDGPDVRTGDSDFDRSIQIFGSEPKLAALLDRATRERIRCEVELGTTVRRGAVVWQTKRMEASASVLVERVKNLIALADSLSLDETQLLHRLAQSAVHEPNVGAQLQKLRLLYTNFEGTAEAVGASRSLLGAASPRVRLLAARHCGNEGFETLRAMTEGDDIAIGIRNEALSALVDMTHPEVGPLMERALAWPDAGLRRTAVIGVGRARHRPALSALVALLAHADGATALAIAAAARRLGDPAAEPALIRLLESESTEVRIEAATALGEVGTIAAVEPLLACTKGILADSQLKSRARAAIGSIQNRLGDVEEGRLSLLQPSQPDGALSLTTDAGSLSMADDAAVEPPAAPRPQTTDGAP